MSKLRSAIRALKSTPVPVGAAILTLALAIGTNAGMVGLIDRALLSPPDQISDPDRVMTLAFEQGEGDQRVRMIGTSYVTYAAIRDQVRASRERQPGTAVPAARPSTAIKCAWT